MIWLPVLVPLVVALAVAALPSERRILRLGGTLGLAATLVVAVLAAAAGATGGWRWGPGLELLLAADGLARVVVVLVPAVAAPIVVYASTHEGEDGLDRLIALMCVFVAGMELLVLASDFLTLLVGWEIVGACSWGLIGHGWRDPENPKAALHAWVTTHAGSMGLIVAAGLTFSATGGFGYAGLAELEPPLVHAVAAGILVAAAAKSAQGPFAPWLFSAMAGPTSVSALLHSATMVAAGAYLLARLAPLVGDIGWFGIAVAVLGAVTAVVSGAVASVQMHLKKALAASTSEHYGLILVAVGAASTAAAGAHLVNHAVFKALLFCAGGIALARSTAHELGREQLGRALPVTSALFGVGALALAAVPPVGAAWSKEQIVAAAEHTSPWLEGAVMVAGFLSALYAARLYLLAFGRRGTRDTPRPDRAELSGIGALAVGVVALGLLWLPGAKHVVEGLTGGRLFEGSPRGLALSLLSIAIAFGAAVLLSRRGSLETMALPEPIRRFALSWLGLPEASRRLVVDPVLALSRGLGAVDDRVVDGGVRAAGRVGETLSRLLAWWSERGVDGIVVGVGAFADAIGRASRSADERGIDAGVEGLTRAVGRAGTSSRRLQPGPAHRYMLIAATGALGLVAVLVWWR